MISTPPHPTPIWFQQSRREKNLQKVAFGCLVASSSVPARSWQQVKHKTVQQVNYWPMTLPLTHTRTQEAEEEKHSAGLGRRAFIRQREAKQVNKIKPSAAWKEEAGDLH